MTFYPRKVINCFATFGWALCEKQEGEERWQKVLELPQMLDKGIPSI